MKKIVAMIVQLLIGGACGFAIATIAADLYENVGNKKFYMMLAVAIIIMFVSFFVHIIIHEAGHLVFGLISGYKFSSFRIGSLTFIKIDGKIKTKRMSLAGTGGQCLMIPPDMKNGEIPIILYNLGGALMNLIVSAIAMVLFLITRDSAAISMIFVIFAIVGIVIAAMNGIPMRLGMVDNDGYNAFSMGKNKEAMRAFWIQLQINAKSSEGQRLKDMPAEWFEVPSEEGMQNSLIASLGVFACNRLMDEQRFSEADELMARLLRESKGIVGLYRNLMVCDRIYCELAGENRPAVIERYLTKDQKKFMKAMKNYISVVRTQYVIDLLYRKDITKATETKMHFEKCALKHPNQGEVESEMELVEKVIVKQEK